MVQWVGNKLFFDKRDRFQLELLAFHGTSQEHCRRVRMILIVRIR